MGAELRRTECVTFPRSGHGLLQKLLHRYFEEGELVYCESYADPERMLDHDPRTNFQKNHDLELGTPIKDDRQYLVQIRYPIESIVSWYQLACEREGLPDSPGSWTNFAVQKASFWMGFYRKWVMEQVPRRRVVNYADLVERPVETMESIVAFLGASEPDLDLIRRCCDDEQVGRRSFTRSFKYYGPGFFALFRGLFAAVPGVDVTRDELVVPAAEQSGLPRAVGDAIVELRRSGVGLTTLADRLSEIKTLADAVADSPQPT